jgi:hypothetical protein
MPVSRFAISLNFIELPLQTAVLAAVTFFASLSQSHSWFTQTGW